MSCSGSCKCDVDLDVIESLLDSFALTFRDEEDGYHTEDGILRMKHVTVTLYKKVTSASKLKYAMMIEVVGASSEVREKYLTTLRDTWNRICIDDDSVEYCVDDANFKLFFIDKE